MCGIVGVAGDVRISRERLLAMRDALRHRGPDDEGVWWSDDGRVGLGHRRLAIIDLSAAGRQPMTDATGSPADRLQRRDLQLPGAAAGARSARPSFPDRDRHRSHSRGLSRVGQRLSCAPERHVCVRALRPRAAAVLLARDPAGEKPLFLPAHGAHAHVRVGAEGAARRSRAVRESSMPARSTTTWRSATCRASAASCAAFTSCRRDTRSTSTCDSGAARTWAYWTLPPSEPAAATDEELLEELERLLADSVRLRLIADVPVGVMLSGGVDSSLVTAMAARVSSRRVKTFTISFPGHGAFDEAPYARAVARHFDTEHVELAAEPATVDLLPELARQYDEPIADSSMVPTYLVSKLIRREATVALGGDGGDELFGGYFQHSWVQQQAGLATGSRARAARRQSRRHAAAPGRHERSQLPAGSHRRTPAEHRPVQRRLRCRCAPALLASARRAARAAGSPGSVQSRALPRSRDAAAAVHRARLSHLSRRRHSHQSRPREHAVLARGARAVSRPAADRPGVSPAAGSASRHRSRAQDPAATAGRTRPAGGLDLTRKQGFSLPLENGSRATGAASSRMC